MQLLDQIVFWADLQLLYFIAQYHYEFLSFLQRIFKTLSKCQNFIKLMYFSKWMEKYSYLHIHGHPTSLLVKIIFLVHYLLQTYQNHSIKIFTLNIFKLLVMRKKNIFIIF